MPAFVIAEIVKIHDPKAHDQYKTLAPASIFKYGGRYAARGGTTEALEGKYDSDRYVVLEFPDGAAVRKWWNSPEYAEAKRMRQACATSRIVFTEGPALEPPKP